MDFKHLLDRINNFDENNTTVKSYYDQGVPVSEIIYPDMLKPIYIPRHEIFDDLDEINFINLIHRYYMGDTVKSLLEEYSIKASAQKFITNLPYFEDTATKCPYCEVSMLAKGVKSEGNGKIYAKGTRECNCCGHITGISKCKCYNCEEFFQLTLNEDIFESRQSAKTDSDYEVTSSITKLAIAAILRSGQDEHDVTLIHPNFLFQKTKLTPTKNMSHSLISHLYNKKWIRFDDKNAETCFEIKKGVITSYDPFITRFRLNVIDDFSRLSELIYPDLNSIDTVSLNMTWRDVAVAECLEYLEYQLSEYKLTESTGPKTTIVIQEALKHFSVSQTFNFIWVAVKDAAAYYQKDRVTKKHAVNSISGSIQRRLEKTIAEEKEIKGFRRDFNLPQSIYADLVYTRALKLGDRAFEALIDMSTFDDDIEFEETE